MGRGAWRERAGSYGYLADGCFVSFLIQSRLTSQFKVIHGPAPTGPQGAPAPTSEIGHLRELYTHTCSASLQVRSGSTKDVVAALNDIALRDCKGLRLAPSRVGIHTELTLEGAPGALQAKLVAILLAGVPVALSRHPTVQAPRNACLHMLRWHGPAHKRGCTLTSRACFHLPRLESSACS